MPGNNPTLETAILTDNLPALSHLLTFLSPPAPSPVHALTLSARLSRPVAFSHLLTHNPDLILSLNTESFLLSALTGGSVPIWRIILAHEPTAKNRRFSHYGTVVERCVVEGKKELLEYLLGEGARVEGTGRPILLRPEVCGADEEIKEVLVRYWARKDFANEEEA
ncbi:hypothetical protein OEA41_000014 [Lepraria neglecta]|uniref:Uncharacterized protein n=1 Tax=Lepraria neglecta TaxID=209136 RepID=A0AAE0DPE4_9LECA|nr:hypothetical protein OEA41_000014 [Lepraria neglecta]